VPSTERGTDGRPARSTAVASALCDSEAVPIVIRSSPRLLAETAGLVVPLCLGVVVYSIWDMSEPWSDVLPFVAELIGVMAAGIVAFFGAMWLWYGSCKVASTPIESCSQGGAEPNIKRGGRTLTGSCSTHMCRRANRGSS
jgi:hypothetical protein